ncbi:rhomboid family intramembrane serine protease [Sansalvadorimonas sp. 2012CJ34-2]|uniref:Rhomboid family intramembrane serine protease n=1 Tax=Parendozoicomonas callyspongiae TaxID=2942213 RepID=A0ABT0PL26_9GAMM|nr:rhomboid family intramembrane serine protease [Sansalvadorimonas sp. 2012CJ34-2]MCL6272097.1 rhomboid family intramembrane serine protease [Sansalvadorimonas sp. 2012CJ34-2]
MIRVFDLPAEEDLLPFTAFLWQQGIVHRITEEGGRQVLWVEQTDHYPVVQQYYQDWKAGLLQLGKVKAKWRTGGLASGPLGDWRQIPVTILLLLGCLIVAVITRLGANDVTAALFTMNDYVVKGQYIHYATLQSMLEMGEYWRLITPVFLHFGIAHLLFNALWVMDFGRRIELQHKGLFLIGLVAFTGIVSNILQYTVMDGFPRFGGMSGVIYGLLGFCWIREKEYPKAYDVPSGIYMFMLVWLVIGFTGVLDLLGFGKVANAAHAGGLLSGVAAGWLYNRRAKRRAG